eukprot:UN00817
MREMFAKEEAPEPAAIAPPAVVAATKPTPTTQPVDLNDITCQAPTSLFADEPVQPQQIEETVQVIEEQQQPTIIRFNFDDEVEQEQQVNVQSNTQDLTPTINQRDQVEEEEETVQTIEQCNNYVEQTIRRK